MICIQYVGCRESFYFEIVINNKISGAQEEEKQLWNNRLRFLFPSVFCMSWNEVAFLNVEFVNILCRPKKMWLCINLKSVFLVCRSFIASAASSVLSLFVGSGCHKQHRVVQRTCRLLSRYSVLKLCHKCGIEWFRHLLEKRETVS